MIRFKNSRKVWHLRQTRYWHNLDKTSFFSDPDSLKIAGAKRSPAKWQTGCNGQNNTHVPVCISASGEKLPLLVIFSGKSACSSWLPIKDHPDVYFSATMKECKTAELIYNWFRCFPASVERKNTSYSWRPWLPFIHGTCGACFRKEC